MTPVLLALALVACMVVAVEIRRMSRDLDRHRRALYAIHHALLHSGHIDLEEFFEPIETIPNRVHELLADWAAERDMHAQEIRSAVEALEQMRKRQPVDPGTARWIAERARLLKAMYRYEEHLRVCRDEHGGNGRPGQPRPRPAIDQAANAQIGVPA